MNKPMKIIMLAAVVAVAGCAKTENTYQRNKPTYQVNQVDAAKIETDPFLSGKAQFVQARQAIVQQNLLKVDVEFINNDAWSGDIDYKFEWFDDQGMPVETPTTGWGIKHVQAQEHFSLDAIAPNPQCKDFRLKLQRDNKS
jgi:uncharacterized protein YcfL